MYFCVNEFEVGANDRIFSGNEQQKVYYSTKSCETLLAHLLQDAKYPKTKNVLAIILEFRKHCVNKV